MAKPLVGAFMVTDYPTLAPDMPVFAAVDLFIAHGILGAAVLDVDERLVGFFSEVDCMRLLAIGGADHDVPVGTVADHMVTQVRSVPPEMDVYYAAGIMMAGGFSYLPVVQKGAMIGLINRRAILRAIKEHFEREMASP